MVNIHNKDLEERVKSNRLEQRNSFCFGGKLVKEEFHRVYDTFMLKKIETRVDKIIMSQKY